MKIAVTLDFDSIGIVRLWGLSGKFGDLTPEGKLIFAW
jgi:hypothetical protein